MDLQLVIFKFKQFNLKNQIRNSILANSVTLLNKLHVYVPRVVVYKKAIAHVKIYIYDDVWRKRGHRFYSSAPSSLNNVFERNSLPPNECYFPYRMGIGNFPWS